MYTINFFVRIFVFLIFCCLNKYFSSEDDDSSCCCECCEDCLEDKESDEESEKNAVIGEEYKYDKNTNKNVSNSKYRLLDLPNVPFFSSYNTVNHVIIPFAFKLRNEYFEIFPREMQKIVRRYINKGKIQENNVKIFFCYQYLTTKIIAKGMEQIGTGEGYKDINEKILFRPHFFIAKKEIDKNSNDDLIYSNIYPGNKCIVFNNKKKKILSQLERYFSIHGGCLSCVTPSIYRTIKETSSNVEIYYSFVLELEKKIAAMTIHFFKCPDEGYSLENIDKNINPSKINTINDAINFAETNGDKEVVDFLNSITKE